MNKLILLTLSIVTFMTPSQAQLACVDLSTIGEVDFSDNVDYPQGSVIYSESGISFVKMDDGFVTGAGGDFIHWGDGIIIDLSEISYENKVFTSNYSIGYGLIVEVDGVEIFSVGGLSSLENDTTYASLPNVVFELIHLPDGFYDIKLQGVFHTIKVISGSGGIFEACVQENETNSIEEINDSPLALFPNPTSSILFVQGKYELEPLAIYNLQGNIVKSQTISTGESVFVDDLANGLYIIKTSNACASFVKE